MANAGVPLQENTGRRSALGSKGGAGSMRCPQATDSEAALLMRASRIAGAALVRQSVCDGAGWLSCRNVRVVVGKSDRPERTHTARGAHVPQVREASRAPRHRKQACGNADPPGGDVPTDTLVFGWGDMVQRQGECLLSMLPVQPTQVRFDVLDSRPNEGWHSLLVCVDSRLRGNDGGRRTK